MMLGMLQDRLPGTRFEIVNTGITAINSHAILPIARDCAHQTAQQFGEALKRFPGDAVFQYKLATVLARSGEGTGAAKEWEKVVQLLPHRAGSYESLGMVLCQIGKNVEAENNFQKLWRSIPNRSAR